MKQNTQPFNAMTENKGLKPKYSEQDMFKLPISADKKVEITAHDFEQQVIFFNTFLKGDNVLSVLDKKVLQLADKFLNEGIESVDAELLEKVYKDINRIFAEKKDVFFNKYIAKYGTNRPGFQKFYSIEHANECVTFIDVVSSSDKRIPDVQKIFFKKLASGKIKESKNNIMHSYDLIMDDVSIELTYEDKRLMDRVNTSTILSNTQLDYADILSFSVIAFRAFSNKSFISAASMYFANQLYSIASSGLCATTQKNAIINGLGMYLSAIMPKVKPIGEFSDLDGAMNQIEFNVLYEFVNHNPSVFSDIIKNEPLNILHFLPKKYEKDALFNAMVQESSLDTITKIHVINYYYKNIFNN